MADTNNVPSSDRDIEFCEKAINAGYIVKEIVPSILRKLNEKRISGIQSSIGQELIALDIMSREQVKEVLLMLENVELTCENCGKRYAIRAYDPGRQYACRECGAYLEPADADMRMLKREQDIDESDADQNASSSIGDPNPQLANLLPPEEEDSEYSRDNDPILAAAKPGSLKDKGIVGKNVFSLDDDMLGEMQKAENAVDSDELNRILGIDTAQESAPPIEKPSIARERKIAAQKMKENTTRKHMSERRKIQKGDILNEMQNQDNEDEILDNINRPSDRFRSVSLQDLTEEDIDFEDNDVDISGNKLMNQSEFLRMIDPETEKAKTLDAEEKKEEKGEFKKAKKETKQKQKEKKFEKPKKDYKKYKQPYSKSESRSSSGINYLTIGLLVLFFSALISAVMMYKLWSDKKTEIANVQKQLKNANKTIRELSDQILNQPTTSAKDAPNPNLIEGMKMLLLYEEEYMDNPKPSNAKRIGDLIKSELVTKHPGFIVNAAEFYQKAGLIQAAIYMLIDSLSISDLKTEIKLNISLKIAELSVFNISEYDLSNAVEYIEKALELTDLTEEQTQLLQVWSKVLKGQHFSALIFNPKNSYENNLAYLVDKFAGRIPSLKSKFNTVNLTKKSLKALNNALLLYENSFSVQLIGCLNTLAADKNSETIEKFNEFQEKFGKTVYMQNILSQLYTSDKDFKNAQKVLTWLIDQKKDLPDREKRRDTDYKELLIKRAEINVKIKEYSEAISDYKDLIDLYPVDAYNFRVDLGKVYMLTGNYLEASDQFSSAYQYNSKDKKITKLFIESLIMLGTMGSAIELLNEMRDEPEYKKDCDIIVLQGLFYMKKSPRDVESAIDEFNNALVLDKNCINALYYKALIELEQKSYDSAMNFIERLEEIDDSLWQIYFLKGIYNQKKKPDDANAYFNLALKTAPPAYHEQIKSYMK